MPPTDEAQGGQQESGQQNSTEGNPPPWEQAGEQFDPERAWNTIQTQRTESEALRGQLSEMRREIRTLKTSKLPPDEKAIEEAKHVGRTEAAREYGTELARTVFDAAAGRRNPDFKTDSVLEVLSLDKFVSDDGKVDRDGISKAVANLIPAKTDGTPDFEAGGGSGGGGQSAPNMSALIRKRAGITAQ